LRTNPPLAGMSRGNQAMIPFAGAAIQSHLPMKITYFPRENSHSLRKIFSP
jgi:hypothetical protein